MRLAGQAKGGFYPAPPEAVALAASLLAPPPEGRPFNILDPCCGEGEALKQLALLLACPKSQVYAIELDQGRGALAAEALKGANVLQPASFLGCQAKAGALSYAWVNPPYDDEIGGGDRVEAGFLFRVTGWLCAHGVLQLAVPERVAYNHKIREYLCQWYEQPSLVPYPDGHRQHAEVIVTARKRRQARSRREIEARGGMDDFSYDVAPLAGAYAIPSLPPMPRFEKVGLTDQEKAEALFNSPLRRHLEAPPAFRIAQPPLPLSKGHIALLLASGHLDGVVRPDGEPPHVVRGTATKVRFLQSKDAAEDDEGNVTTKKVYAERIVLVVRAVTPAGDIYTFADKGPDAEGAQEKEGAA